MKNKDGQFIVTMEHPNETAPKPLVIDIDRWKATVRRSQLAGPVAVTAVPAPRAG